MNDREIDTMNTSSIDLICCALGGVLLIMLLVATLVRTRAEQVALEPDSGEAEQAGQQKGISGWEAAPPRILIVTLRWDGLAKYPPRLKAFPPRRKADRTYEAQTDQALEESKGFVRVDGGGAYFGFFDRRPGQNRAGGQVELVIPRGSRDDRHYNSQWKFRVEYDDTPPASRSGDDLADSLANAFKGLENPSNVERSRLENGNAFDQFLFKEVLSRVPGPASKASDQGERHRLAVSAFREVEKALAERSMPPLSWAKFYDPVEKAQPGGGAWLREVRRYGQANVGTDPASEGQIDLRVGFRAYPQEEQAWKSGGQTSAKTGPSKKLDAKFIEFSSPDSKN